MLPLPSLHLHVQYADVCMKQNIKVSVQSGDIPYTLITMIPLCLYVLIA